MFKKTALSVVFAIILTLSLFNSRATAASTVIFCLEASCSSMTVIFGGQTHSSTLNCDRNVGWTGVPAGTYSYSVSGCGLTGSGSITVDGTSSYMVSICPPSGGACCSTGCGTSGAYNCSQCSGATTTTTTAATTTTTTTSAATTTTTTIAATTGALVVKDSGGTTTFKVEDDGSVAASGNVAIGTTSSSVPLLVQATDTGHLATFFRKSGNTAEIQIGESTAVNKAAVIGFSQDGAYYYMSVYGLGLNRLVFNSSGYLGVGTTTPSYPLQMGSSAYCSIGGVWTNASSREYKTDVKQLSTEKAMDALTQLKPVEFAYKADSKERHVGFISEDAPEIVASKDRKGMSPMDVVAVLTKVVQEQQKLIQEQKEIVQKQQKTIGELSEEVAELRDGLKKSLALKNLDIRK